MLKINKKKILHETLILAIIALVVICVGTISYYKDERPIYYTDLDMTYPIESSITPQKGTYTGERSSLADGKKQLESIKDIDSEKFFIMSYSTSPTVKGSSTNMWIENVEQNMYDAQTLVIDTDTNQVIYISPLMKPGTYVDEQKLLTKNAKTIKSYEVQTYLYLEKEDSYKLHSVNVASLTFHKNKM